jgi:hypothetical protein
MLSAKISALANGALAHAFELDNLTRPGAGVHLVRAPHRCWPWAIAQTHGSSAVT